MPEPSSFLQNRGVSSTPCRQRGAPPVTDRGPPIPETAQKYLTVETLATLKGHLHQRYQRLLEFQFETGLRPEELIAMHADQIDGAWLTVSNVYPARRRKGVPQRDRFSVAARALCDAARGRACAVEALPRGPAWSR
ncbi:hypothetical protein AB0F15_11305 [Amycolatopsis sp. NPDC026612]|uniref:hypothetical protein n=1 Tax=Amycolatopsis sp. NPDC026612 TaxID=3155466 RepID=UPI0033FCFF70